MTINESTSGALAFAHKRFHAFVDDLTPEQWKISPIPGGNSPAWIVLHVAWVDRRLLQAIGAALPEVPEQFEALYTRGAKGGDDATDPQKVIAILDAHVDAIIAALRSAPPEVFDRPIPNNPLFPTVGHFASAIAAHTMLHGGQLSMIRRLHGKSPVF